MYTRRRVQFSVWRVSDCDAASVVIVASEWRNGGLFLALLARFLDKDRIKNTRQMKTVGVLDDLFANNVEVGEKVVFVVLNYVYI
ncbi:hypothetical protein CEXT_118831 [Caerostris extrusa]|uniref:Uncharacterized protein n=1 Tax=Caerostris extrusa TaxID=172846 RepID=A0AAV4RR20_CAEEX|nr:hypothetical protein CEXT_118831 [Caerostris extrusa]